MGRARKEQAEDLGDPCRHGSAAIRPARNVGPGAHAAGVDPAIKSANIIHLRRIEGQIRGIAAMVAEDRYCPDVITQVAAARESLRAVARNLMRNHLKHCAGRAMREGGSAREAIVEEILELAGKVAV